MNKSTIPSGVKTLKKWFDTGMLNVNHPVQRASGQWNNLQASLLFHSMLSDFIIPPIYLIKEKDADGNTVYHLIEGKQRLTNIFSFLNDEYALHSKTPTVVIDGVTHELAEKKFSELSNELQDLICGFRFTIYQIEDASDEEIEESFARLNSGTPLSKIQLARPKMGADLASWANELVKTDFFQKSLNLTLAQLRREDDFLCLMQSMMLLDRQGEDGFVVKTSASAAECVRFAEHIRGTYPPEKKEVIEVLVMYLNEAFGSKEYKLLRKNNIPIVCVVAQVAIQHEIPALAYAEFVVDFFTKDATPAYNEASGSGNVKLVNVDKRIYELTIALMGALSGYFDDEELSEVLTEDENSDITEENTSLVGEPAEDTENPATSTEIENTEADSSSPEHEDNNGVASDASIEAELPEEGDNGSDID